MKKVFTKATLWCVIEDKPTAHLREEKGKANKKTNKGKEKIMGTNKGKAKKAEREQKKLEEEKKKFERDGEE